MVHMIRIILVCIAILTGGVSGNSQGVLDGFIDAPKSKNLALSLSAEKAKIYYLREGTTPAPHSQNSISLYYKHQFTKWFGAAVNLPLVNYIPHDGNLYLKFGSSFKINDVLSINGVLGLGMTRPLSDYEADNSDAIGQQAQAFNFRAITQITIKNSFFLNMRVGHDEVKKPTPSANIYSIKVGYYKDKWYGDLWYENIAAGRGKDYLGVGDLAPSTFRELGVSSAKIGGVVYHQTKEKLGFFLGGAKIVAGRNTRGTRRISLGLVLKI